MKNLVAMEEENVQLRTELASLREELGKANDTMTALLPPRFRSDLKCDFHQGALGHDVEGCYALRYIVKKLIHQGKLTFENNVPHILDNPLPNHAAVNMIEVYEEATRLDVRNVATPLVPLHIKLCKASLFNHDHANCPDCFRNLLGCYAVQNDIQSLMNDNYLTVSDVYVIVPVFHDPPVKSVPSKENVEPLVIRLPGPVPYTSTKAIPYKYNATGIFYSAEFVDAITEEATGCSPRPMFVIPGGIARNWDAINIHSIMHVSE